MKNIRLFGLLLLIVGMAACSGSDTYRGAWKATDANGNKFDIVFDAKSFVVKDAAGSATQFDYTQNSIKTENSVETYGIKLSDGRGYKINFPNAKDESVGLIYDDRGNGLYTISRKEYIKYEDISRLK